jgi:hypothetical protein
MRDSIGTRCDGTVKGLAAAAANGTACGRRAARSTARTGAAGISASNWASSRAEPMCSMFGDPRREDHMIWAAVVHDVVFWRL